MNKDLKILLMAFALIIISMISFNISGIPTQKEQLENDFYSDKFECYLILEQHVACINGGCMNAYGINILNNIPNRLQYYYDCVEKCEERYFLIFNERDGSIKECGYWEVKIK